MDGNSAFTVHSTAHAFRAAINFNSMLLAVTTDLMFRKLLIFDGLTNFMLKWIWCGSEGNCDDFYLRDVWVNPDYFCQIEILIANGQQRWVYQLKLCTLQLLPVTPRDNGERGHCFLCSFKKEATGPEVTFHNSVIGNFMVNKIYLKQIYCSYSRSHNIQNVFLHCCCYFWGQHCCWTETNILVKNFLFFISSHFPQHFYCPLPYRCYLRFI